MCLQSIAFSIKHKKNNYVCTVFTSSVKNQVSSCLSLLVQTPGSNECILYLHGVEPGPDDQDTAPYL